MKLKSLCGFSIARHWAAVLGLLLGLGTVRAQPADLARTLAEKIKQATVVTPPLEYVGEAVPPEAESRPLWTMLSEPSDAPAYDRLQRFVVDWPQSGWTPSVRAHLGQMHRAKGRYTLALQEWEKAWLAARDLTNSASRSVAEYALANWSQLLASLGRTEKLAQLFVETAGRKWDNASYAAMFARSREGYETMLSYPGVSYRCGTFALSRVAQALGSTNAGAFQMVDIASPSNGFCLSRLAELSEANHLGLVAVERPAGASVILPSVIHWRQNHYAAVLAKEGPLYWVMDPTFGHGQWIFEDYLNEEASGKFLVPATNVPAGWKLLAKADTDTVFGKGQPATMHFAEDQGCNRAPGGAGAPASGTVNSGGNQAVCQLCGGEGMPVWWVSEPYINLFVADVPLSYRLSDGNTWSFRWTYKQRDVYPIDSTSYPSAPPMTRGVGMTNASWTHNFLSYIRFRDTYWDALTTNKCSTAVSYNYFEALVYLSGGGVLYFNKAPTGTSLTNGASGVRLEPTAGSAPTLGGSACADGSGTNGFRLVYPDGSQDIYNRAARVNTNCSNPSLAWSEGVAYLMMRVDAQGRTNSLCYETTTNSPVVTRVKQIVDFDGRSSTLSYANDTYRELPTQVTDPYGRSAYFNCDGSGRLDTLVDTAGLTNTISYQSNQEGFITGITTPYGTTSFEHFDAPVTQSNTNQGNAGGHNRINKYISVVDRDGSREVFMYRYESSFRPDSYATNEVPAVGLLGADTFDNGTATSTGAVVSLRFRNSFHWGKKQMTLVSNTNATNFTAGDYLFARVQHWLDQDPIAGDVGTLISDRLALEIAPTADGTNEGFKTWYDYSRSGTARYRVGANALIGTIATVLPDGTTSATSYDYRVGADFTPYVRVNYQPGTVLGSPVTRSNTYAYAANGIDLLSHTFPGGAVEKFGWSSRHQLIGHTNEVNDWTTFSYTDSRLAGVARANGTRTDIYYTDALPPTHPQYRMLTSFTDSPAGRTISFPAWTNGLPQRVTGDYGLEITNTWDAFNRLTGQSYSDGTFISNRYSKLDLSASRDRLGYWTWFAYDAMQRLTAVTNANTNVTQYGYCGCGALETITDALVNVTTLKYDGQLRLTNVVMADSNQVFFGYDNIGRRVSQSDGTRTWTFTFNRQNLPEAVSNAFGQVERILYDQRDNSAQITDAAGVTVTNAFDALGRLLARSWPDNGRELFGYNTNGLIRYTNQLGFGTRYAYDANGLLSAVTNANGEVTRFSYTTAGDLFQLIDGKNQTNQWNRDVLGRVTNKVAASGQTMFGFSYDANGRLTNRWTPAKGNAGYTLDPVGNLLVINYSNGVYVAYAYDALNQLKQMTDAAGTSAFTYTKAGQLASEGGLWSSDTLTNVYTQGLRTSTKLGTTWTNAYAHDAARRLTNVTSGAGSFGYQFVGASALRQRLMLPSGAFITNSYDGMARLTNTMLFLSAGEPFVAYGYGYNQAGQRTWTRGFENGGMDFAYDGLGQLKSAEANYYYTDLGYGYDAAGNLAFRTNQDGTVRAFRTDQLNQLTNFGLAGTITVNGVTTTNATNVTVNGVAATLTGSNYTASVPTGDGTNTLTAIGYELYGRHATSTVSIVTALQYDANQNLLYDGQHGFAYDEENQITTITQTNAFKSEFVYDGLGRRRIRREYTWTGSAWNRTNETRYVFDGLLPVQERDSNNTVRVTYTRGLDLSGGMQGAGGIGGLLARTATNGTVHYFADGNGNVSMLLNATATDHEVYFYEPFGRLVQSTDHLHTGNEMQFSSMLFHSQSGLTLYHARPYSPHLQRWLSADPIGELGGINLHGFVDNDPVDAFDPLGLLGNLNRPPETVTSGYEYSPIFRDFFSGGTKSGEWNPGPKLEPQDMGMIPDVVMMLVPVPGLEEMNIAARATARGVCKAAAKTVGTGEKLFWGTWNDYPKATQGGRTYAQVGDRLYAHHAVDRMQPSGIRFSDGNGISPAGAGSPGRSISPNFIEDVIQTGSQRMVTVDGVPRQIFTSGSVEVVTEQGGKLVITVNPFRH